MTSGRIAYFPVAFFASTMGLGGLAIAHSKASSVLGFPPLLGTVLMWITAAVLALLLIAYASKIFFAPQAVAKEFASPVTLHFFPTISISILLLSIALLHHAPGLAQGLWVTGAIAHLIATLATIGIWIRKRHFEMEHMKPTWFIPVVGNILVPVAGVSFAPPEVNWFFFAIGLVFWLMLFTIFLNRLIFHEPVSEKRLPTMFILIAPPAVGFIAYVRLTGEIDPFARILYSLAVFLFLLLVTQFSLFWRIRFYLSWWAYSFPLAALTIATLVYQEHGGPIWFKTMAAALLLLVTIVVIGLVLRTLLAMWRREICSPEH